MGRAYLYLRPQYCGYGTSPGKPVPLERGGDVRCVVGLAVPSKSETVPAQRQAKTNPEGVN